MRVSMDVGDVRLGVPVDDAGRTVTDYDIWVTNPGDLAGPVAGLPVGACRF